MSFSILFPTNQFTAASKSPEEIQKLTLPACLSIQEILTHIASKGVPAQYPYLYTHMAEAHKNVLGFVCQQAPGETGDNQLLIGAAFKRLLLERGSLLTSAEKQQIFEACLECLNSMQSPASDDFVSVIELLLKTHHDRPKLLRRMESAALQLGKPSQPSISKVTAGRLVVMMCGYGGRGLRNQLFDVLKRVLGDSEAQARKIGLGELFPRLLSILDLQFVELHFQEKIYEAVWDENEEIAVVAVEAILRNAGRFSALEQGSRIVKLFVDALTSKRERVAVVATELMGEAYQKLQAVILRSEGLCVRFWKSLVELSQSRNEKILNNLVYNLPGILTLAAPYHRVDPLCDIYIELFYHPLADKLRLASYFGVMVRLFPSKGGELKDLLSWMLGELLETDSASDEAIKITGKILFGLGEIKGILLVESAAAEGSNEKPVRCFEAGFCNLLVKFLDLLVRKKVAANLVSMFSMLKSVAECFSSQFAETVLLPRLYGCLRGKVAGVEVVVELVVMLLSREGNPVLTNSYFSRVSFELMKSSRGFERQIALSFLYHFCIYFSIQTVQELKIGEKYLSFNNDKSLSIRASFIRGLPRVFYYLSREEKIEYSIIVGRFRKDSDYEIQQVVSGLQFREEEKVREEIMQKNKALRGHERERLADLNYKKQQESQARRPIKDLRKEEVVRKRMETSMRGKNKILIKEVPKRRMTPMMVKASSNTHLPRHS